MKTNNRSRTARRMTILACSLLILGLLPSLAFASTPALPPRPTAVPPTPTPIAAAAAPGSYIELQVPLDQAGLWAVVQWQSTSGQWYTVSGWQGTIGSDGLQKWWVAPADYGKGPFRWVVYDKPGGSLLTSSAAFNLPLKDREVVKVTTAQ